MSVYLHALHATVLGFQLRIKQSRRLVLGWPRPSSIATITLAGRTLLKEGNALCDGQQRKRMYWIHMRLVLKVVNGLLCNTWDNHTCK